MKAGWVAKCSVCKYKYNKSANTNTNTNTSWWEPGGWLSESRLGCQMLCANTNTSKITSMYKYKYTMRMRIRMIKWKQVGLPNALCANANSSQPGKHPSHRGNNMDMDIWHYFKQKTGEENFGLKGTKSRNKERTDDNTFWDIVCTTCNMILQRVPFTNCL